MEIKANLEPLGIVLPITINTYYMPKTYKKNNTETLGITSIVIPMITTLRGIKILLTDKEDGSKSFWLVEPNYQKKDKTDYIQHFTILKDLKEFITLHLERQWQSSKENGERVEELNNLIANHTLSSYKLEEEKEEGAVEENLPWD